jgi:hypothetical protein
MVRKIFDFYTKIVAMVTFMRYISGDGKIQVVQVPRRHHVSKNFKIDEEWKKL